MEQYLLQLCSNSLGCGIILNQPKETVGFGNIDQNIQGQLSFQAYHLKQLLLCKESNDLLVLSINLAILSSSVLTLHIV